MQDVRSQTENNKTAPKQLPYWLDQCDESGISAQKNTFALGPVCGSLKKDVKGQAAKNNNRPPDKQKRA
ncbi:hypothetical protein ALQ65_102052 [Pseudomonas syringae pv. coriandricola]|uniref:Uncharacterized protein n=1 Tax=Pseudomonas syringae pv. coriandricola TaxID=264453 RepID=A0A0P9QXH7_9PSED|nr:hypothetical protein ALO76_102218 [Pseudomonas syringae pv. coriandricola]RMN07138.1 hypothetical protein ALQ65_102052 [Pseudomonas syringae pv. coriandricola]